MKQNHQNKINLTKKILLSLLNAAKTPAEALIKTFLETPYKGFHFIPKKQFYPRFVSLERAGYIKRNDKFISLTQKGKKKALYVKWQIKKINIKNWDGKWRVISFDVPEKKKRLRENLRIKLRSFNLYRLHDSVWVTPLPIEKEIDELLEILEIKYFIRYMIVEKINFDKDLKKKFFNER